MEKIYSCSQQSQNATILVEGVRAIKVPRPAVSIDSVPHPFDVIDIVLYPRADQQTTLQ